MTMTRGRPGLRAASTGGCVVALAAALLMAATIAPAEAGAGERARTGGVDAASFARRVVGLIARNRYERAWQSLHPIHQAAAGLAEYVHCENMTPIPGRLVSVTVGRAVSEATVLTPGHLVASKAVRVRVQLLDLATGEPIVVATKVHVVRYKGRWRWLLPQARFAEYLADRCAGAPHAMRG
jgi:hypothetical protein